MSHNSETLSLFRAVRAFAQTPQFQFLKNTPIARVLNGAFSHESWPGDLCFGEIAAYSEGAVLELTAQNVEFVRAVIAFLQPHIALVTEEPPATLPEFELGYGAEDEAPFMGSIEAELKYEEALKRLTSLPRWKEVAEFKLGEFWAEEWLAAPFEQSLLLRQLPGVDVKNLLRKKLCGPKGVRRVIGAMHRAADALGGDARAEQPKRFEPAPPAPQRSPRLEPLIDEPLTAPHIPSAPLPTSAPPSMSLPGRRWQTIPRTMNPALKAVLHHIEEQAIRCQSADAPLARLIRDLPVIFTPEQQLAQWLASDGDLGTAATLLGLDSDHFTPLWKDSRRILSGALESVSPALAASWKAALGGTGVPTQFFSASIDSLPCHSDFKETLLRSLLVSLGAERFTLTRDGGTSYWTTNISRRDVMIGYLLEQLPLETEPLREEIQSLLPTLNHHEVLEFLDDRIENMDGTWRKRRARNTKPSVKEAPVKATPVKGKGKRGSR